jgi:hypothetical protein
MLHGRKKHGLHVFRVEWHDWRYSGVVPLSMRRSRPKLSKNPKKHRFKAHIGECAIASSPEALPRV